jgi:hypothetical protein
MNMTPPTRARAHAKFLLVVGALAVAYLVVVPVLWLNRGVVERQLHGAGPDDAPGTRAIT